MKITILTYGSRGDVQPFIHLTEGLTTRGHLVKLVAPARFTALAAEHGISLVPLAGDPAELSRHLNDSGSNFFNAFHWLLRHAVEIGADVLRQVEDACSDTDMIIHTFMHAIGAHTFARENNIPDVHIQLFPMFTPTGDYPNVTMPDLKLRFINRWTHLLSHRMAFWSSRFGYQQVRRRVGLAGRKLYSPFDDDPIRPPTPVLCAWSPSLIPPSGDWKPNVHVTGYFFGDVDPSYQPPGDLQRFLDAGDAPVCVSFGSMLNRDAERINLIVCESLRRTSNRGIILSGWSDLKNLSSKDILYLDAVPHQWLLPRCRMIVHHGGAGTTAAGLRAGIPNLVIAHMADQPFWGSKVHTLGAGPKPISVKKLSVESLTTAIEESGGDAIRKHAHAIGRELQREVGVRNAMNLIERCSSDFLRKDL